MLEGTGYTLATVPHCFCHGARPPALLWTVKTSGLDFKRLQREQLRQRAFACRRGSVESSRA